MTDQLRTETLAAIAEIITNQASQPIVLTESTNIRELFTIETFGLDSLDFIEIVMAIEDRFNIIIEDDVLEVAKSGKDFIDMALMLRISA